MPADILSGGQLMQQTPVATRDGMIVKGLQRPQQRELGLPQALSQAILGPSLRFDLRQGQQKVAVVQALFPGLPGLRFQLVQRIWERLSALRLSVSTISVVAFMAPPPSLPGNPQQ
jgi:hypothetical protein